ncbi:MAG: hypothetical protein IJ121_00035 [Eubacterium sp.]|nr:hypothetical protein [Eubacterium sp.]
METIKNYLESMFAALPNTSEVLKAKYELGQMMEDKYTELIEEGKAENEAVGIVISEFGNLDELAEALGIEEILRAGEPESAPLLSQDAAREYIADASRTGFLTGLGVLLCICSPAPSAAVAELNSPLAEAVTTAMLFLLVAAGVGLFIYSSVRMSRHSAVQKRQCRIDYGTAAWVNEQRESFRSTRALFLAAGVILCIISVVPESVMGILDHSTGLVMGFSAALIFIFVGIGVMMIVSVSQRSDAYNKLLNLNASGTVGSTYRGSGEDDDVYYENNTVGAVMSVYWPTITCIYLIWSFLTFRWGFTWIIWPIAAIVETLIKRTLGTRRV